MNNELLKAVVIGDYTEPDYHPMKNIEESLKETLLNNLDLTFTEDRNYFNYEELSKFNLCILYVDSFGKKLSQQHIKGLLTYVLNGGGLLVIHNGLSYQDNAEFAQLVGGKFVSHPPYQMLNYRVEKVKHPILEGVEDFEMTEELYTFDIDNFSNHEILLYASNLELTMPAAWVKNFGEGKVVYLAPGHDAKSFDNTSFRKLIVNSAMYVKTTK
jgi:uncharacterized protein